MERPSKRFENKHNNFKNSYFFFYHFISAIKTALTLLLMSSSASDATAARTIQKHASTKPSIPRIVARASLPAGETLRKIPVALRNSRDQEIELPFRFPTGAWSFSHPDRGTIMSKATASSDKRRMWSFSDYKVKTESL